MEKQTSADDHSPTDLLTQNERKASYNSRDPRETLKKKKKKNSEDLWSRDPPWSPRVCSLEAGISSSFTELLCF